MARVIIGLMAWRPRSDETMVRIRHACNPARNHVHAAQIGLGEGREDRSILLTASEINGAQEPAEQPGGVELDAMIGNALEGEACDRQRACQYLRSPERRDRDHARTLPR